MRNHWDAETERRIKLWMMRQQAKESKGINITLEKVLSTVAAIIVGIVLCGIMAYTLITSLPH